MDNDATLLTLTVEIIGTEPVIWRRIDVDAAMVLEDFHDVLQAAMGWTESHLHAFADRSPFDPGKGALSLVPRRWLAADSIAEGLEGFDEANETVGGALAYGDGNLWYEYDFGDGWVHVITKVSRRPRGTDDPEAAVLDGARRAPLEDCGGIGGWAALLRQWSGRTDGRDDDISAKDLRAWIEHMQGFGRPFDPDDFDATAANVDYALGQQCRRILELVDAQGIQDPRSADRFVRGLERTDASIKSRHRAGRWLAGLDPWCQHEFGMALHRAGIDPLGGPVDADLPSRGRDAVAPYQWLLQVCGNGGLDLTPSGNLNQKSVARVLEDLGWTDHVTVYGTGKTENVAGIAAMLRRSALGAGLVKKDGKKLVATTIGRKLVDDPVGLWRRLCQRAIPTRTADYNRDVVMLELLIIARGSAGGKDLAENGVWKGLEMIGYARPDGAPLSQTWFIRNVEQLADLQQVLGTTVRRDFAMAVLQA